MSDSAIGRETCWDCNRKMSLCFCKKIQKFSIEPLIVLLVHPKEFRKTIGTFRLVKLSITNSVCVRGYGSDFDKSEILHNLIADSKNHVMILFPGPQSLNLSEVCQGQVQETIPPGKRLVILVIDGTWANARKMIRTSQLLSRLPKLSFNPKTASKYQIRKQPSIHCLSTVEAVHALIENLSEKRLCELPAENIHSRMLENFKFLVDTQIDLQVGPVRY